MLRKLARAGLVKAAAGLEGRKRKREAGDCGAVEKGDSFVDQCANTLKGNILQFIFLN